MLSFYLTYTLGAYVLGSIPFGKLIGKLAASIDITERGSKNIGATNVAREIGLKWGFLSLILDILKGFIPVFSLSHIVSVSTAWHDTAIGIVGLSALLGHQFSLFLIFKGGKGVATALGFCLGIAPMCSLVALLLFLFVVQKWDYISLGSIVSALTMPLIMAFYGIPKPIVILSFIMALLICGKHRGNITRLLKGKEPKWRKRPY